MTTREVVKGAKVKVYSSICSSSQSRKDELRHNCQNLEVRTQYVTLTTIDPGDSFWAETNETLFAMDCMISYGFSEFILEGDVLSVLF